MYESYRIEIKPYKDHARSPAISIYVMDDNAPTLDKLSCIYCKRTIYDMKGVVETIIMTPMPLEDFGIAVNVLCKLCKQNYRLLMNPKTIQG